MAEISVNNLTFSYETSYDNIFENTSFQFDTDWKLGFIGRNGKGKTTFLNLLLGKYDYRGTIVSNVSFDYFPFQVEEKDTITLEIIKTIIAPFLEWDKKMRDYEKEFELKADLLEESDSYNEYSEILNQYLLHDGYQIEELIKKEIAKLKLKEEVLYRPFSTLSNGEQTKLLLAGLFLKKNNFLLIDEPTNHLDMDAREVLKDYLATKKGFLLVSHDRDFIDHVVDHILSINRNTIEVIKGNFSTWQENKNRRDQFELAENEKLEKSILHLEVAVRNTAGWSDKIESTKIGAGPVDRGYIGAQSAKMMKRAKAIEHRKNREIEEKSKLLKDIDTTESLKMNLLEMKKNRVLDVTDLTLGYLNEQNDDLFDNYLFKNLTFTLNVGERIALSGKNGCGKSSILKFILDHDKKNKNSNILYQYKGNIKLTNDVVISYVPQDTSFLKGSLKDHIESMGFKESTFKMLLRKLDFPRIQFEKNMEEYSEGQKKKVLLAGSLISPSHLFIWDEPLNYIDVLSRIQIEELLLEYQPTMLFVEHDTVFTKKIATKIIHLNSKDSYIIETS
ncbi:ribosomal protection-like ABC-F family protein [Anaeromicropila herbilytica]|uniref:Lsa family ABC-F type ribosomal protection protein n=1 Tax=Anaeromicropila herbilytica TaxID=2785025 RepID=A0A7R7ID56_9FIRM|nr:ABC-F type ribosomal protection protein [Anaeromicropila herbilytica]BCN30679.1 Lsa family ABC-F type ribosomal protection protein [Anaeromicropila herbilytica]